MVFNLKICFPDLCPNHNQW